MAKVILTDAAVTVNGIVLSDHVRSVSISMESDEVDVTGMGATAKERLLGIRDDKFEVEFYQDFAAGSVDATLAPLVGVNTPFPVEVKPTSGAVSATNPKYTANCVLKSYSPLDGSVGDASTMKVTFLATGKITRATT